DATHDQGVSRTARKPPAQMESDGAVVSHHQIEFALICPDHRSKNLAENVEELLVRGGHFTKKVPRRLTGPRGFLYLSPPGSDPPGPKTGIWRAPPGANQRGCYLLGGPGLRWT